MRPHHYFNDSTDVQPSYARFPSLETGLDVVRAPWKGRWTRTGSKSFVPADFYIRELIIRTLQSIWKYRYSVLYIIFFRAGLSRVKKKSFLFVFIVCPYILGWLDPQTFDTERALLKLK